MWDLPVNNASFVKPISYHFDDEFHKAEKTQALKLNPSHEGYQ